MVLGNHWLQEKKQVVSSSAQDGPEIPCELATQLPGPQGPWLDQAEAVPHHALISCSSRNPLHSTLGWKALCVSTRQALAPAPFLCKLTSMPQSQDKDDHSYPTTGRA